MTFTLAGAHRLPRGQHPYYKASARGPNGRPLCRFCLAEIPAGRRRTFCSAACVTAFKIATNASGWIRPIVFARDRGVCAVCGRDTVRLRRVIGCLAGWIVRSVPPDRLAAAMEAHGWGLRWYNPAALVRAHLLMRFGWSERQARSGRDLWDADHTVPLVEGGEASLANLRTLCVPCHARLTAELAKRKRTKEKR
jgi:hypothetical protein